MLWSRLNNFFFIILEIVCNQTVTRPANSKMFGTSSKYAATLSFTCNHGYKRIGAEQITCLQDGKWDKDPPQCQGRVIFFLFFGSEMCGWCCATFIRHTCCCGQLCVRHLFWVRTCDGLYHFIFSIDRVGIPFWFQTIIYSEIGHIHLSIEAQCVTTLLPLGDCHTGWAWHATIYRHRVPESIDTCTFHYLSS